MLRHLILGVLLLGVLALTGCAGGRPALSPSDLRTLQPEFERIDALPNARAVEAEREKLMQSLGKLPPKGRDRASAAGKLVVLIGYTYERLGDYEHAYDYYTGARDKTIAKAAGGSPYASVTFYRGGLVAKALANEQPYRADEARRAFERAKGFTSGQLLVRNGDRPLASQRGGRWVLVDHVHEVTRQLDPYYQHSLYYQAVDFIVESVLGADKRYSYALAIVLIALLVKLITTPLSGAQFKNMAKIQSMQPELKRLQEKHRGDREALMKEQMLLYKRFGINPASGCLPLIVQMPILFLVWKAISQYQFQFYEARFFWIGNLAVPDMPLLVAYAISMYFSQKLLSVPTADPQQQATQKMMTIMMPMLLMFMFMTMASAFILYWFLQNVLMTVHQFYVVKHAAPQPAGLPGAANPEPAAPKRVRRR